MSLEPLSKRVRALIASAPPKYENIKDMEKARLIIDAVEDLSRDELKKVLEILKSDREDYAEAIFAYVSEIRNR